MRMRLSIKDVLGFQSVSSTTMQNRRQMVTRHSTNKCSNALMNGGSGKYIYLGFVSHVQRQKQFMALRYIYSLSSAILLKSTTLLSDPILVGLI